MSQKGIQPLNVGLALGSEFTIKKVLGRGAFGITYLVQADMDIDHSVKRGQNYVVKELAVSSCVYRADDGHSFYPRGEDDEQRQYFWNRFQEEVSKARAEAELLARLQHPSVVEVLLIRSANQTAFIVMEFIDGRPLADAISEASLAGRAGLNWKTFQPMAMDLLSGLESVHHQDIIHRDLKPANVMLRSNGRAVLIDFGGAREQELAYGSMVFTPGAAPLEQIHNWKQSAETDRRMMQITKATDIYGMAATFYMALTGTAPYRASDDFQSFLQSPPLSNMPHMKTNNIPKLVAKGIDRALNFTDANARPQSVSDWKQSMGLGGGGRQPGPSHSSNAKPERQYQEALSLLSSTMLDLNTLGRITSLLKSASDAGHKEALYRLARLYQSGPESIRDSRQALLLFRRAYEQGDLRAAFRLAVMQMGEPDQQSRREAFTAANRAAEGGMAAAMNLLGRFYRHGIHVSSDNVKACDWYERGVRAGDSDAAHNLATMYSRGMGRKRDSRMADRLDDISKRLRAGERTDDMMRNVQRLLD